MSEIPPDSVIDKTNMLPIYKQFDPTNAETRVFGRYVIDKSLILPKPLDVADDHIAYNPSSIWTVLDKSGKYHDIMYVRVEPNISCPTSSHLGKAKVRPYVIDVQHPEVPLHPYYDAEEKVGEDAALTSIKVKSNSGKLHSIWLLSCVDPKPKSNKLNEVESLVTRFYAGPNLCRLEHVADGPEWMKDIRVAPADGPLGTELEIYGRPQLGPDSGNITHTTISSLSDLNSESIANASFIDDNLLPPGCGVWGGVNDVMRVAYKKYVLAAHRAKRTGLNGRGRVYEAVFYGHNASANRIVELGVVATADMFAASQVKEDTEVELDNVVFMGGGYNGHFNKLTFGVRDAGLGFAVCSIY